MKKKTGAGRSLAGKRSTRAKRPAGTPRVADYIAEIPEGSRKTFDALRAAVRQAVPKDAEEIISYGIPALRKGRVLVWYAAFGNHCSLFPTASVLAVFKEKLKPYKVSKGTVQFPLDRPLPIALVKKMVRARVAEADARRK